MNGYIVARRIKCNTEFIPSKQRHSANTSYDTILQIVLAQGIRCVRCHRHNQRAYGLRLSDGKLNWRRFSRFYEISN